jgi:hypothetical protein
VLPFSGRTLVGSAPQIGVFAGEQTEMVKSSFILRLLGRTPSFEKNVIMLRTFAELNRAKSACVCSGKPRPGG